MFEIKPIFPKYVVFEDRAFTIMNIFSVITVEYRAIKLQLCPGTDVLILYGVIYLALQHLTGQHDKTIAPQ